MFLIIPSPEKSSGGIPNSAKLLKKKMSCYLKISPTVHVLLYLVKVLHFRQNGPVIERQMCMSYGRLSKKGEHLRGKMKVICLTQLPSHFCSLSMHNFLTTTSVWHVECGWHYQRDAVNSLGNVLKIHLLG